MLLSCLKITTHGLKRIVKVASNQTDSLSITTILSDDILIVQHALHVSALL